MNNSLTALRDLLPPNLGELAEESVALALLDTAHVVVVVLDAERRVQFVNQHFTDLCGHRSEDLSGQDWIDACIPATHAAAVDEAWKQVLSGLTTPGYVNPVRSPQGGIRWFQWYDRLIQHPDGSSPVVLAIGHDVTERERALVEHSQVVEAVFQASNVCLAYLDRNFDFVRVNRAYSTADGKTPDQFVGRNHFEMFPNPENYEIFCRVRDTGETHYAYAKPFEYAHNPERGVTHWDWTLSPAFGVDGEVIGVVLALTDVTTRIVAMEELRTSQARLKAELEEKEVLLREVHHRVKNNLQIISSLLYLQDATRSTSSELIAESRSRVQAIALVHELLYANGTLGSIGLRPYLEGLGVAAKDSYGTDAVVEVQVDEHTPDLDISHAVPCGLLVSELFGNACKHAFVGRDPGTIRIEAGPGPGGAVWIAVADDGVGMPPVDASKRTSLGLTLVHRLAEQLGGTLQTEVDQGTRFTLRFVPRPTETGVARP